MVQLIMGERGTGKTKKLIEQINSAAAAESGSVICIEAKDALTYDVSHQVRLISANEYEISDYTLLRGFVSGMYASNYDVVQIFIDNLFKIVGGECGQETDAFLSWLERFSEKNGVKFTISLSCDPSLATEEMKKYM